MTHLRRLKRWADYPIMIFHTLKQEEIDSIKKAAKYGISLDSVLCLYFLLLLLSQLYSNYIYYNTCLISRCCSSSVLICSFTDDFLKVYWVNVSRYFVQPRLPDYTFFREKGLNAANFKASNFTECVAVLWPVLSLTRQVLWGDLGIPLSQHEPLADAVYVAHAHPKKF